MRTLNGTFKFISPFFFPHSQESDPPLLRCFVCRDIEEREPHEGNSWGHDQWADQAEDKGHDAAEPYCHLEQRGHHDGALDLQCPAKVMGHGKRNERCHTLFNQVYEVFISHTYMHT